MIIPISHKHGFCLSRVNHRLRDFIDLIHLLFFVLFHVLLLSEMTLNVSLNLPRACLLMKRDDEGREVLRSLVFEWDINLVVDFIVCDSCLWGQHFQFWNMLQIEKIFTIDHAVLAGRYLWVTPLHILHCCGEIFKIILVFYVENRQVHACVWDCSSNA